jgi:hypothetical protein
MHVWMHVWMLRAWVLAIDWSELAPRMSIHVQEGVCGWREGPGGSHCCALWPWSHTPMMSSHLCITEVNKLNSQKPYCETHAVSYMIHVPTISTYIHMIPVDGWTGVCCA